MGKLFEQSFIEKLIKQDHQTFNMFYIQTIEQFYRYIKIHYFVPEQEIQDILSDFYLKIWTQLKKIKSDQHFEGYIWIIFKNHIKDYFKKNYEKHFSEFGSEDDEQKFEDTLINDENLTDILETQFKTEEIEKALMHLEDDRKDIIYFKYIEEKSYEEIAFITGLSQENIRKKSSRALKRLKELTQK